MTSLCASEVEVEGEGKEDGEEMLGVVERVEKEDEMDEGEEDEMDEGEEDEMAVGWGVRSVRVQSGISEGRLVFWEMELLEFQKIVF